MSNDNFAVVCPGWYAIIETHPTRHDAVGRVAILNREAAERAVDDREFTVEEVL